ncbi:3-hydroxyacyl-CoA dehydrogenase family protein [Streptomyces solincola]|uniref:3-hydroxyacyl-CoA dehydrogenase family protein n=1 Tax=Streptomyces solincola TaxID=2100817 RepID=UPI002159851A|nr:3-hydroxyacyl-CoA dehydrogenase family protein [Streptomyces solincola]
MTDQEHAPAPLTGIVGLGSVGEELLTLLYAAGHRIVAVDTDLDVLARVGRRLKALDDGRADAPEVVLTADHSLLRPAQAVVEAVPEDATAKARALRQVAEAVPPGTPLLTTTAGLPLLSLALASGRPEDLAGLRLFTPPAADGPVEPVRTPLTSEAAAEAADRLVAAAGLRPVAVGAGPAADATALVLGLLNGAVALYDEGYAAHHEIDTAMRLGCGLALGPLEMLDHIGLDTAHAALSELRRTTGDPLFAPAGLLTRMVAAERLGRKSGEGFYAYDETGARLAPADEPSAAAEARPVRLVGVVGSGTMACGIAESVATAGRPVVLVARTAGKAERARQSVDASLARAVHRGRRTEEQRDAALALLESTDDAGRLADCDLVIEAVAEDLDVKRRVFAELGARCAPGALLATTTSSLSVAACERAAGRPGDVVGIHFFNPAPLMRLVELVRTDTVRPQALATAEGFCRSLGKTPVTCPDRTGFIVNSLLFPYLGAAMTLLERRGAGAEETDAAVQQGFGYPMGPFTLLDTIGLDVSLAIQDRLFEHFGTPEHEPSPALRQLVAAGFLGRKNRRGLRTAGPRS